MLDMMPLQVSHAQVALDIGCGRGVGVLSLASEFSRVVGIDVSLLNLIMARKLLDERGIANFSLTCACAEALPFRDGLFGFVTALDVIEHVSEQKPMLAEMYRVLKQGGACVLTSPNRYFVRDSHVDMWGVGFVPRRFTGKYVAWMSGGQIKYEGKRLLSYLELRKMLQEVYGRNWVCRVYLVDRSVPPKTILGKLYRRLSIIARMTESFIYKLVCPVHTVVAWKVH
jgi:ubiquinone/menaquinone biosynthesis C-methylase UbiE